METDSTKANWQQNLLRKSLHFNYEYYHKQAQIEFSDPDWAQKLHISKSA